MTKTELAKQLAATAGLTGEQAKSAVDAVFDTIAGELAAGDDVANRRLREVQRRRARRPARAATPRRARRSRSPPAAPRSSPPRLALKSQLNG